MNPILAIREVEKPWGRDSLPAPFGAPTGARIGEIWFEPPPQMPELLVKYIFTSEALSVQVHPSDAQVAAAGLDGQGKEECWLIIDAHPGARIGIGFRETIDAETMRAAALDGTIEDLLQWRAVRAGDFFYIPAGVVHAIGAGVSLIEVQQNSNLTYRLYDYGRPRELHLDQAVAVARGEVYPSRLHMRVGERDDETLVEGAHFRLDQIAGRPNEAVAARYGDRPLLVIPRRQTVRIDRAEIAPGGCALAPRLDHVAFADNGVCLIAQPHDA